MTIKHKKTFNHMFTTAIPDQLEEGIIYISLKYNTVVHKCACGCGEEVVTPLSPAQWKLLYDGETITLTPSIGNWSYRCRSHYWIRNNQVHWADQWSDEKIAKGRIQDQRAISEHNDKNKNRRSGLSKYFDKFI